MSLRTPASAFVCTPASHEQPRDGELGTVTLLHNGRPSGRAVWHAPSGRSGAVQLLELVIAPEIRRQRHGTRLVREVMKQCSLHLHARKVKPRRLWVAVEQKTQVIARAFLTHMGFHHTSTIKDVLEDQDLLVYVLSFD